MDSFVKIIAPDSLGGLTLSLHDLSPLLRPCSDLARATHIAEDGQPQFRETEHPEFEYHCHELLSSRFLQAAGVEGPAVIGAALVHDVPEDSARRYGVKDSQGLQSLLSDYVGNALKVHAKHPTDPTLPRDPEAIDAYAGDYARRVASIVAEVTRHRDDPLPKDEWLRQHLPTMSGDALLCKMADACANLFQDAHAKTKKTYEQRGKIIRRAEMVAAAGEALSPDLAETIRRLAEANRQLMAQPSPGDLAGAEREQARQAIAAIREAYRWDALPVVLAERSLPAPTVRQWQAQRLVDESGGPEKSRH